MHLILKIEYFDDVWRVYQWKMDEDSGLQLRLHGQ